MRGTLRQAQDDLFRVLTMTFKVIQEDGFWRLEDGFPTTDLGNDKDGFQHSPRDYTGLELERQRRTKFALESTGNVRIHNSLYC